MAPGSVISLRGGSGRPGSSRARPRRLAPAAVLLAAWLTLAQWVIPAWGAMTEPEPGGAVAAETKNTQPEPQTPHVAGEKTADAEQPSPTAPPPSAQPGQRGGAEPARLPASETPAPSAEDVLRPFGYAFFENAPETFAPIPDTAVPRDYVLGPGDKLRITFWSVIGQETTIEPTVDARGQAHVPLLGLLTAGGVTIEGLEATILSGLRRHFANVEGQVTLASLRSLRVLVAGEARRPGAYTVSSLSTAFNVLYQAGGPNGRGSMRCIRLLRGDREVGVVDLYEFLLTGKRTRDYRLVAGDTLFIPVAGKRVGVRGEVRRPALYELLPGETLAELVEMAGGIEPSTYLRHLQIERIQEHERRIVLDLDLERVLDSGGHAPVELLDGDIVNIYRVLDKRMNTVELTGQVARPGVYELKPEMRISDLVEAAQGLRGEVYLERAEILRTNADATVALFSFDLEQALNGGENPLLQRWDRVLIYPPEHMRNPRVVSITGQVRHGGSYPRHEGMRITDLLFAAGGVRDEAYLERANLMRRNGDGTRVTIAVNLSAVLAGAEGADVPVCDGDQLLVYSQGEAQWRQRSVSVAGAVQRPGACERTEHITLKDLLFWAGGLLPDAFLARANLTRCLTGEKRETIALDLEALLAGRAPDVELRDGDHLLVYRQQEVEWRDRAVTIEGAVQRPAGYERTEGMTVRDLVFQAGGLLPEAFASRANLVRCVHGERKETIPLNLRALLAGEAPDVELRDRDHLVIYRREEVEWREGVVRLDGAVQRPGAYERTQGITLGDLLFQAGGLLPQAAGWAEVARARTAHGTSIIIADLNRLGAGTGSNPAPRSADDILLRDGDRVLVPEVGQYQRAPQTVRIAGEVQFPGAYALQGRGETLGHLLGRAGGLTPDAFLRGAVFIRRIGNMVTDYQEQIARQVQAKAEARADLQYQLELAKGGAGLNPALRAALPLPASGPAATMVAAATDGDAAVVAPARKLAELISSGRVPIDLSAVSAQPGGSADLPLEEGDLLWVPRRPTTVLVTGAAVSPGAVVFAPGQPIDYYVQRTGGYDDDANIARVVVLRANGTVLQGDLVKEVEVGDIVIIPSRPVILREKDTLGEIGKALSAAANAAMAFYLIREVR